MLQQYAGSELYGAWGGHRRKRDPDKLGPRQEEILSYFIGLGPVGSMVEINRKTLYADCGFNNQQTYYMAINALIRTRHIRRVAGGSGGSTGLIVVLRRGGL